MNFPTGTGGENYFTPPAYTAVGTSTTFSATTITPPPGPAMERNSFTGPLYQSVNVSLAKGFNLPEARVIGDNAGLEFRVDTYNLFNLTEPLQTPTTSIVSTVRSAQSTGALARSHRRDCRRASRSDDRERPDNERVIDDLHR